MLCLISAALKKADPIVDKLDIKSRKPWNFRIFFKNFKVSRNLGANLSTMGPAFFRAAEHRGLRNCINSPLILTFLMQNNRHNCEKWLKWNWKKKPICRHARACGNILTLFVGKGQRPHVYEGRARARARARALSMCAIQCVYRVHIGCI